MDGNKEREDRPDSSRLSSEGVQSESVTVRSFDYGDPRSQTSLARRVQVVYCTGRHVRVGPTVKLWEHSSSAIPGHTATSARSPPARGAGLGRAWASRVQSGSTRNVGGRCGRTILYNSQSCHDWDVLPAPPSAVAGRG
jgi:hypothetical protein